MRLFPSNPLLPKFTGNPDPIGRAASVQLLAKHARQLRKTCVYQTNLVPFMDTRKISGPKPITVHCSITSSPTAYACWPHLRILRNARCALRSTIEVIHLFDPYGKSDLRVLRSPRTHTLGQGAVVTMPRPGNGFLPKPLPAKSTGQPDPMGLPAGGQFPQTDARQLRKTPVIPNEPSPIFEHSDTRRLHTHNYPYLNNVQSHGILLQVHLQQNPNATFPQSLTIRIIHPLDPECISDLKLLISSVTHKAGLDAIGTTPRPGKGFRP